MNYQGIFFDFDYTLGDSTDSRTLKRGRQRLYRCLRYGAANLLEQANS